MQNELYCTRIYKGIYIEREADNQSRISACCVNTVGDPVSVINFHKDPYLVKQRQDFAQGIKTEGCKRCWDHDDRGIRSLRSTSQYHSDPLSVNLESIDYNVAPLCNAKCITCGSYYSSLWAQEEIKFGYAPQRVFNQIHRSEAEFELDYTHVRRIYFNGGEPFLSPDINMMLGKIKAQVGSLKQLELNISTNGSILPKPEDVVLWNECGAVRLSCSIEAVGEQFEYIRYPLNWKEVSSNIVEFTRLFPRLFIVITPNIGMHNALEWPRLSEWFEGLKAQLPASHLSLISHPTIGHLSFDHASRFIKELILRDLEDKPSNSAVRNYIISSQDDNGNGWRNRLEHLDERRDLDWRKVFPRLAELWKKLN
jgi:molybdenum cofactor biosynthesis enzyme MoaA